jgi:ABC-type transporter Mla MlaB component
MCNAHFSYEVVARGDDSSSTDSEDSEGELERKQRQRVADEQRAEAAQKQADDENERMMQIMQVGRSGSASVVTLASHIRKHATRTMNITLHRSRRARATITRLTKCTKVSPYSRRSVLVDN